MEMTFIVKHFINKPENHYFSNVNLLSLGTMGDERTYDYAMALSVVTTSNC